MLGAAGHRCFSVPDRLIPRLALAGAGLIIIEDSGHTGSTAMTDEMHRAADRLYEQITNAA
jgi:hypothetical protein